MSRIRTEQELPDRRRAAGVLPAGRGLRMRHEERPAVRAVVGTTSEALGGLDGA